jgi:hypothetical protein
MTQIIGILCFLLLKFNIRVRILSGTLKSSPSLCSLWLSHSVCTGRVFLKLLHVLITDVSI